MFPLPNPSCATAGPRLTSRQLIPALALVVAGAMVVAWLAAGRAAPDWLALPAAAPLPLELHSPRTGAVSPRDLETAYQEWMAKVTNNKGGMEEKQSWVGLGRRASECHEQGAGRTNFKGFLP